MRPAHQLRSFLRFEPPLPFEPPSQVFSLDVLRYDVTAAVVSTAHVVNRHDPRMVQLREVTGFNQKIDGVLFRGEPRTLGELDRDLAQELSVLRQVDGSEGTLAELAGGA